MTIKADRHWHRDLRGDSRRGERVEQMNSRPVGGLRGLHPQASAAGRARKG